MGKGHLKRELTYLTWKTMPNCCADFTRHRKNSRVDNVYPAATARDSGSEGRASWSQSINAVFPLKVGLEAPSIPRAPLGEPIRDQLMKAAANWRQELTGRPSRPYAPPSPVDEFQREGSWPSSGPCYITERRGEPTGPFLQALKA